jgi:hypothetical protein
VVNGTEVSWVVLKLWLCAAVCRCKTFHVSTFDDERNYLSLLFVSQSLAFDEQNQKRRYILKLLKHADAV